MTIADLIEGRKAALLRLIAEQKEAAAARALERMPEGGAPGRVDHGPNFTTYYDADGLPLAHVGWDITVQTDRLGVTFTTDQP